MPVEADAQDGQTGEKIMNWNKYREDDGGFIHMLPIADTDAFMKVEKTRGGDYSITAIREGDPCGGEVEYAPDLQKAKAVAERLANNGEYKDLLL